MSFNQNDCYIIFLRLLQLEEWEEGYIDRLFVGDVAAQEAFNRIMKEIKDDNR